MCEIGQLPLPCKNRPFFLTHPLKEISKKSYSLSIKEIPKKSPPRPAIRDPRADRRADPDRSPSRSPSRSDWSTRSDRRRSPTSIRSDRQRNDIHADGMTYTTAGSPSRSPTSSNANWLEDHGSRLKDSAAAERNPRKTGTRDEIIQGQVSYKT